MKSILLSIKPKWLAKILNGEKTIEVRKKFPKDYVGWVYLYCSKSKDKLITFDKYLGSEIVCGYDCTSNKKHIKYCANGILNGKVVARFWCDKVEELIYGEEVGYPRTKTLDSYDITEKSAIWNCDIKKYLKGKNGYAVHISKLEIFDEPRELKYFHYYKTFHRSEPDEEGRKTFKALIQLNKAPQNYCYIEGE